MIRSWNVEVSSFGYHSNTLTARIKKSMVSYSFRLTPRLKGNYMALTFPDLFREQNLSYVVAVAKAQKLLDDILAAHHDGGHLGKVIHLQNCSTGPDVAFW